MENSAFKKESFHANEHATFFKVMCFLTFIKHVAQLLEVSLFEDSLNVFVYLRVKGAAIDCVLFQLAVDLAEILFTELLVAHKLRHSLFVDFRSVFLHKLSA